MKPECEFFVTYCFHKDSENDDANNEVEGEVIEEELETKPSEVTEEVKE